MREPRFQFVEDGDWVPMSVLPLSELQYIVGGGEIVVDRAEDDDHDVDMVRRYAAILLRERTPT